MPRKAKDTTNVDKENIVKKEVISKKSTVKKVTNKKSTQKSKTKVEDAKNANVKKTSKSSTSTTSKKLPAKKTTEKSTSVNLKKAEIEKTTKKSTSTASKKLENEKIAKKPISVSSKTKKATTKSKNSSIIEKEATKNKVVKQNKKEIKSKKVEILEYYDLPYRYNQTVVKIIAQTPTTLFVYWDVSDEDKNHYIKQYGEYFYNNTKPVLIIHNVTKNYNFEIDINDYANSWYLKVNDSKCDYKIELGRRGINKYINIPNNYLHISSSNELEVPNDHILFERMNEKVYFKNVKTGQTTEKNIASISFLKKIGKLYNIKEFYKQLYTNNNFTFEEFSLKNPSSGNPTSTFK